MYHHNPKDTMSSAFSRTGFVVICLTLVVNLALYPVLRTLGFQIHSAITGSYVPGYHSVLLINCPTEQTARDIGSLSKRANFLKELIALKSEVCYDWPVNQCVVIGRILQACDGYVTSLTISGTSDSNASVPFRGIMEKRLAACVNIFPRTATMYYWKGEIRNASEILLLVRTRTSLVQRLEAYLRAVHPYDIPEIISFPIGDGSLNYLKWMENALIDI